MSRSAHIEIDSIPNGDIHLSGILAEVISGTIGLDRACDNIVTLSKGEVLKVMLDMVTRMSEELKRFDFQEIQARSVGYHKLEAIMLWHHETADQEQLTFC